MPIYNEFEVPKVPDLPEGGDLDAKTPSGKKYLDLQLKTNSGNFTFSLYEGQNLQSFVSNLVQNCMVKQPMNTYL
jgi:hypothetical protein